MSEHIHENIDAYLAGGLPNDEREHLERHIAGCPACAGALAAARKLDGVLDGLFLPVRPDAGLEDRAIRHLRQVKPRRRSYASKIALFVGGIAAVLLLGFLGAVMYAAAENGDLPFPGMEREGRAFSFNDLRQIGVLFDNFDAYQDQKKQNAIALDVTEGVRSTEGREMRRDPTTIGLGTGTMAGYDTYTIRPSNTTHHGPERTLAAIRDGDGRTPLPPLPLRRRG